MDHKEVQMLAAEFVLGTLSRAMLLQFKNELSVNPALRTAVKDWERRFGMERGGMLLHPGKPGRTDIPSSISTKGTAVKAGTSPTVSQKRDEIKSTRKRLGAGTSDPLLDLQTQREVQAALDQISLDSTLESRVRCGQAAQRAPRRTTAAKPTASRQNLSHPKNMALALAGESSIETSPEHVPSPHKDTNTQARATQPKNADTQEPIEAESLSKDQAARKVQAVLRAAQNILAKQDHETSQNSAAPEETPKEVSQDPPSEIIKESSSPLIRAEDGEWEALAPRVYKKQLNRDDNFNRQSYLLRMIPGGRIQPQRRGGIEEVYVIEGRVAIGEETLKPGDFQAFDTKSFVPEIVAASDSLILIRGHIVERIPDPEGSA